MKILVTGSNGFVGRNLVAELNNMGHIVYPFDTDTDLTDLHTYTRDCEFVFHLAGVNRPKDEREYMEGNVGFTSVLLNSLKDNNNTSSVLMTSSIQATRENAYGISKKAAEDLLFQYSKETGTIAYIYRLNNLFGKWCRPNYNSVVATYCHNIARNLEIQVNDNEAEVCLCYIDDVIDEFIRAMNNNPTMIGNYCHVPESYSIRLGDLASLIQSFKANRNDLKIANTKDPLTKKLYSTYLSYLPTDHFSYPLKMNCDQRGSFTEFIRTPERGQLSVNVSKPGITKGNHWHRTKNEKFLVVSGEGLIRFRKIDEDPVIEYRVSGSHLEVVDIPIGYTHSIMNVGEVDLVTIIWTNEVYNPDKPDTYFLEV